MPVLRWCGSRTGGSTALMVVAIATFLLTGVAPRMRLFISQTLPERLDSMAGPTSSRGKWVDTRYQLRVSHVRRPR